MTSAVSSQVASSRSAQHHFEAGHRIAYMAVRLENIMALYHRHATQFGFVSDEINRFVVDSLREKASLQTALNELDHAVRLNPNNVAWQDEFALVLEQLGRDNEALRVRTTIAHLDPSFHANSIALGRLLERVNTAEDMKEYYAGFLKEGTAESLLALSRSFAFSERVDDAALMDLKKRVRLALANGLGQVALHLALRFIAIAERDYDTARASFLCASLLAERPENKPATTQTNAFNSQQASQFLDLPGHRSPYSGHPRGSETVPGKTAERALAYRSGPNVASLPQTIIARVPGVPRLRSKLSSPFEYTVRQIHGRA